jgi:hypothetical protein
MKRSVSTSSFKYAVKSRDGCPICLEAVSETSKVELGCGHHFCRSCLAASAQQTKAVNQPSRCPVCRVDHVLDPEVLSSNLREFRADYAKWRVGTPSKSPGKTPKFIESVTRVKSGDGRTQNTVSGAEGQRLQTELLRRIAAESPATKDVSGEKKMISMPEMKSLGTPSPAASLKYSQCFALVVLAVLLSCYLLFPAASLAETKSCDEDCLKAALNSLEGDIDFSAYDNGGVIFGDAIIQNKQEAEIMQAVQNVEALTLGEDAHTYEQGIIWGDEIIGRMFPSLSKASN